MIEKCRTCFIFTCQSPSLRNHAAHCVEMIAQTRSVINKQPWHVKLIGLFNFNENLFSGVVHG